MLRVSSGKKNQRVFRPAGLYGQTTRKQAKP